jgi:hypothetical protein
MPHFKGLETEILDLQVVGSGILNQGEGEKRLGEE